MVTSKEVYTLWWEGGVTTQAGKVKQGKSIINELNRQGSQARVKGHRKYIELKELRKK